jgi:hypothetical protein
MEWLTRLKNNSWEVAGGVCIRRKKLKVVKMAATVMVVLLMSLRPEEPREGHTYWVAFLMMWLNGRIPPASASDRNVTMDSCCINVSRSSHKPQAQKLSTDGTVRETKQNFLKTSVKTLRLCMYDVQIQKMLQNIGRLAWELQGSVKGKKHRLSE